MGGRKKKVLKDLSGSKVQGDNVKDSDNDGNHANWHFSVSKRREPKASILAFWHMAGSGFALQEEPQTSSI